MSSFQSFIAPRKRLLGETAIESRLGSSRNVQNAVAHDRYDPAQSTAGGSSNSDANATGFGHRPSRFYPAQLRRLLNLDLMALSASRKHRLTWGGGWDEACPVCICQSSRCCVW